MPATNRKRCEQLLIIGELSKLEKCKPIASCRRYREHEGAHWGIASKVSIRWSKMPKNLRKKGNNHEL